VVREMRHQVAAMDLWFATAVGTYPFEVRCEILSTLGFDAIAPTLWSEEAWAGLNSLDEVTSRHGLEVSSVFCYLDSPYDDAALSRIADLLADPPCPRVALGVIRAGVPDIVASDPAGDAQARVALDQLLHRAAPDVQLVLYPHWTWWMQTTADALRLIDRVGDPRLTVAFSAYHWFAADGTDPGRLMADAGDRLALVNLSSAAVTGEGPVVAPLGDGELDTFALLGALERVGFTGPIELLGYGVGGDVPARLERSLRLLRETERRLAASPSWRADTSQISPDLPSVLLRDKNWTLS
jgi:sugar phosphate isomerase/epimerase